MPEKETQEQEMRRLLGKIILKNLRRPDVEPAWIGHAARWLDGAGQKLATPEDDPQNKAMAELAIAAYPDELSPVDTTHDDDATRRPGTAPF